MLINHLLFSLSKVYLDNKEVFKVKLDILAIVLIV